jgi:hypothetical protein
MAALSRNNGWVRTRFHGRAAYRRHGDWVATQREGEWQLWRDGYAGESYFASYATPAQLMRDLERSERVSREPKLMAGERKPRPPREQDSPAGWSHDDPRWG